MQDVLKDVADAFKENNLTQDYLKYNNIPEFLDTFFSLLQEDNFLIDAKLGETIFNRLNFDYNHLIENGGWSMEDIIKGYSMQKCLLELRRPTKNILAYYSVLEPIVDYLKNDIKFKEILDNCRIQSNKVKEHLETPTYNSRESNLMLQESYVAEKNIVKFDLFDCSVWCYNLYGNKSKQLFRADGGMRAKNEAEAKLKFKAFIRDKFPSVSYSDKDIMITKVNSIEDIKKAKECL